MFELNNETVGQFVLDLQRGKTFFRFIDLDDKTNAEIGELIVSIVRAGNIYALTVNDKEKFSYLPQQLINNSAAEDLSNLTPINRLIFLLVNYFWKLSKTGDNLDTTINVARSESSSYIERRFVLEGVCKEKSAVDENSEHERAQAQQAIENMGEFLDSQQSVIAPELCYFFNNYQQANTNPFEPKIVQHFRWLDSSLKFDQVEHRSKTLIFFPKDNCIAVQNVCADIMVNVVDDVLDNISTKLPKKALSFLSNVTFSIESSEKGRRDIQYEHGGTLLSAFLECQNSVQATAAFLSRVLTCYVNEIALLNAVKEQKRQMNLEPNLVEQRMRDKIKWLERHVNGQLKHHQETREYSLNDSNKKSTKILPYLVGPVIGFVVVSGLAGVATIIGSPAAGALVLIGGGIGGVGGTVAGIGAAKAEEKIENWQNNRQKKDPTTSLIVENGQFRIDNKFQIDNNQSGEIVSFIINDEKNNGIEPK